MEVEKEINNKYTQNPHILAPLIITAIDPEPIKKQDECMELKNIKYKTMLMNGSILQESKHADNLSNLEKFLEDDKNNSQNEPWSKLDKTVKTRKLLAFAETYSIEKNFTAEEKVALDAFLKDCLDRKKLQRVKDVIYDKTTGEIKMIPALTYQKGSKHFTLKNIDKRVSTLKSLPPKKVRGTAKNVTVGSEENSSDTD